MHKLMRIVSETISFSSVLLLEQNPILQKTDVHAIESHEL